MTERQQDVLHIQPAMVPTLRVSFRAALNELNNSLLRLSREGFLPQPWLGDEISDEVAVHYARRAMNGPGSSYQSLTAYKDELSQIHDTLLRMEDHYRRTEGDNTALWGLRA
jgi:hypothetical protein